MLNSYINLLKIKFGLFSICMLCATIQMTKNFKKYIKKKRNNARCFSINYEILLVVKIYESSNMTKVSQPIRIKWLTHCVLNKHITITQLWFGTIDQIIRVDIKKIANCFEWGKLCSWLNFLAQLMTYHIMACEEVDTGHSLQPDFKYVLPLFSLFFVIFFVSSERMPFLRS